MTRPTKFNEINTLQDLLTAIPETIDVNKKSGRRSVQIHNELISLNQLAKKLMAITKKATKGQTLSQDQLEKGHAICQRIDDLNSKGKTELTRLKKLDKRFINVKMRNKILQFFGDFFNNPKKNILEYQKSHFSYTPLKSKTEPAPVKAASHTKTSIASKSEIKLDSPETEQISLDPVNASAQNSSKPSQLVVNQPDATPANHDASSNHYHRIRKGALVRPTITPDLFTPVASDQIDASQTSPEKPLKSSFRGKSLPERQKEKPRSVRFDLTLQPNQGLRVKRLARLPIPDFSNPPSQDSTVTSNSGSDGENEIPSIPTRRYVSGSKTVAFREPTKRPPLTRAFSSGIKPEVLPTKDSPIQPLGDIKIPKSKTTLLIEKASKQLLEKLTAEEHDFPGFQELKKIWTDKNCPSVLSAAFAAFEDTELSIELKKLVPDLNKITTRMYIEEAKRIFKERHGTDIGADLYVMWENDEIYATDLEENFFIYLEIIEGYSKVSYSNVKRNELRATTLQNLPWSHSDRDQIGKGLKSPKYLFCPSAVITDNPKERKTCLKVITHPTVFYYPLDAFENTGPIVRNLREMSFKRITKNGQAKRDGLLVEKRPHAAVVQKKKKSVDNGTMVIVSDNDNDTADTGTMVRVPDSKDNGTMVKKSSAPDTAANIDPNGLGGVLAYLDELDENKTASTPVDPSTADPQSKPMGRDTFLRNLMQGPFSDGENPDEDTLASSEASVVTPTADPQSKPMGRDTFKRLLDAGPFSE